MIMSVNQLSFTPSFEHRTGVPGSLELDFTDICKYYLGRWGEWVSVFTSLLSLVCATIVYWILLSNFLYNGVDFVYGESNRFVDSRLILI